MIKMYAIFARETLNKMQFQGKLAAQAGHAFLHAWWDAENRWNYSLHDEYDTNFYRIIMHQYQHSMDARKITLVVDTVEELKELYEQFRPYMGATLVEDCGYTVFNEPTITCVGLGPTDAEWAKNSRLGTLKTLENENLNAS